MTNSEAKQGTDPKGRHANLIPNPSFEDIDRTSKLPRGFKLSPDSSPDSVKVDRRFRHLGKVSIRIKADPKRSNSFQTDFIPLPAVGTVRRLRVSAFIKARGVKPGNQWWKASRFTVFAWDKQGNPIPGLQHSILGEVGDWSVGTFGWRRIEREVGVPPEVEMITVSGDLAFCREGLLWFDDLRVTILEDWATITTPCQLKDVSVRVSPEIVNTLVEGMGYNWDYCTLSENEDFLEDVLRYAAWDEQDFVRFGIHVGYHAPKNYVQGKDTGQNYQYTFDDRCYEGALRKMRFFKEHDVHLMLCNWCTGRRNTPNGYWMTDWFYKGEPEPQPYSMGARPYSVDRFIEAVVAMVKHWVDDRGFSNIKYISLWNEPCWHYRGDYPDEFWTYYPPLDKALREAGLRDRVGIMGSDSTESGHSALVNLPEYEQKYPGLVDYYSVHDYQSWLDPPRDDLDVNGCMDGSMDHYRQTIERLRALRGRKVPVTIGEFSGTTSGTETRPGRQYLSTLSLAEVALEATNHGIDGCLKWFYLAAGDSQFCPFKKDEQGRWIPRRETYFGYALLTKFLHRGTKILTSEIIGGKDKRNWTRVRAVAGRNKNGRTVVVMTNNSPQETETTVDLRSSGLAAPKHLYWYDHTLPATIQVSPVTRVEPGLYNVTLRPLSISVLTDRTITLAP